MFVSIVIDAGTKESSLRLSQSLSSFGFKKVQRAVWESLDVSSSLLQNIKKAIDDATDSYDIVRIYQYPMDDMFVVTQLNNKKWSKMAIKPPAK